MDAHGTVRQMFLNDFLDMVAEIMDFCYRHIPVHLQMKFNVPLIAHTTAFHLMIAADLGLQFKQMILDQLFFFSWKMFIHQLIS